MTADIRLGLIGDNIALSRAPSLHRLAGALCGLRITYDRLVPPDMGLDFDAVFGRCRAEGYRGLNITYPYKEIAAARVAVDDPATRAIGAVNTVVFGPDGPKGYNTDCTGFAAAWRATFRTAAPGPVCMVGAGGVGKAVAFALLELGLEEIRIFDRDLPRAERLAEAVREVRPGLRAAVSVEVAAVGARGLINCTPVGMDGHPGTPVAGAVMGRAAKAGAAWAFDAVYTPVDTTFLRDAEAAGLTVMSGYELFFHQGIQASRIFCGRDVDPAALRAGLMREAG